MSKLLRKEQRESQVAQQQDRQNQCDYSDNVDVHGILPQLLARLHVKKRKDEEDDSEEEHD